MSAGALGGRRPMTLDQRLRAPRRMDWPLLLAALVLLVIGLLALYSEGQERPGGGNFRKQLLNVVVGIGPFCFFLLIHPKTWRKFAPGIYVLNVLLLAAVLVVGSKAGGAQRWINFGPLQFQPSEMAKLLMVLTLAAFFANRQDSIRRFSTFGLSLLHIALPAALIFKQPHLGATLVIVVVWLGIAIAGNVPARYLLGSITAVFVLLVAAWNIPGVIKDYQRERVSAMLQADKSDAGYLKDEGYQTMRSQISLGVGGLMGAGFLQGEQKEGRYIPEQHTDFIFTVIGEEGGLVGATLVLAAFGFFFYRVWLVMLDATDPYYRMLVAGILAMLSFHMVVNLGMIMQLLPVVGLWLPFISYGGTAIWLCMSCVALLLNIRRREKPLLF